jgi:hypothetical protein
MIDLTGSEVIDLTGSEVIDLTGSELMVTDSNCEPAAATQRLAAAEAEVVAAKRRLAEVEDHAVLIAKMLECSTALWNTAVQQVEAAEALKELMNFTH